MKRFLAIIVFVVIASAVKAQIVTCGSPFANFGLPVTYCGQVKSTSRDTLGKNSGVMLYLCLPYPNQAMTIVIKDLEYPIFEDYKLGDWVGKNVCATGTVQTYRGQYFMVVKKESSLHVSY